MVVCTQPHQQIRGSSKAKPWQYMHYVDRTSLHYQTTANIFSSGIGQSPTAFVRKEKAKAIKLIQECRIKSIDYSMRPNSTSSSISMKLL